MALRALRNAVTAIVVSSFCLTGAAVAHAAPVAPQDVIYGQKWTVKSTASDGMTYGAWHKCGVRDASPTTGHISCSFSGSTTITVTSSVTGTQEVGDTTLSSAVGYSVAWSRSMSIGDTEDVPKNKTVTIWYREGWYRTKVVQSGCQTVHGACDGVSLGTKTAYTHKWESMHWKTTES